MNAASRLASDTPGQARTSLFARTAARRVRDAAATLRREDVAVRADDGAVERSHRFTVVSGRVDRQSVKGTFGLSLSWRNSARRDRDAAPDGPLAVMRLHLDLHVPRLGRDLRCHRAFFFGSVPAAVGPVGGNVSPVQPELVAEHPVIDLRTVEEHTVDEVPPRAGLFAHNPVVEHEREPVATREPAPVRGPRFAAEPVIGEVRERIAARERGSVETATDRRGGHDEVGAADAPRPEGWHPDPSGQAELRYWDGNRWTAHISTGGRLWLSPFDATSPRKD